MSASSLRNLIQKLALPSNFMATVDAIYLPIATEIARWRGRVNKTIIVGINGCQGSGKSTLADFLQDILGQQHEIRAEILSMDDLYYSRDRRRRLGAAIHPLLRTRGVPGTHDTELGSDVIRQLCEAGDTTVTCIPRFDKATDEPVSKADWDVVTGRPDIVILEGWCLSVRPQAESELAESVNSMEVKRDPEGIWRRYVNEQIAGPYAQFFKCVDYLMMLKAPSFDIVYDWRRQQESRLRESTGNLSERAGIMDDEALGKFIMHYERLTRHMLLSLPSRADILVELVADRSPGRVIIN